MLASEACHLFPELDILYRSFSNELKPWSDQVQPGQGHRFVSLLTLQKYLSTTKNIQIL